MLVPGHPNRALDLLARVEGLRWALRTLREQGEEMPYDPDQLLPWAIDDAGNFIWWHMGGAVAFLAGVLSRRVTSDFLVIDGDPTTFVRYPYRALR